MKSLVFNLIHFNRQPNTEHVRQIISELDMVLSSKVRVRSIETQFQIEADGTKTNYNLYRTALKQAFFEFKYAEHLRKNPRRISMSHLVDTKFKVRSFYSLLLKTIFLFPKSIFFQRARITNRQHIDVLLSIKHLYAWLEFLNSKDDGIVCFEDDVISATDKNLLSAAAILSQKANLGNLCKQNGLEVFDFIDLAGGFTFNEMKIEANVISGYAYNGIVGNTTCCYFASRRLVTRLVADVLANPEILQLGIGFILIRSDMLPGSEEYMSFLPSQTPFKHGSLSGLVPSSIPYD